MSKTIVIVIYKLKIETSKTFISLKKSLTDKKIQSKDIDLILYDNSPESQEFNTTTLNGMSITYVHDARNLGVAVAYNYALNIAKQNKSEWLLLLDHDTEITPEYMEQVLNIQDYENKVAAIVPKITSRDKLISPVYSNSLRPLLEEPPSAGIQTQPVMAINSGALVRVDFLIEIGGFNNQFPLDYLDHWLFFEIYRKNYHAYVLEVTLEHELSVMDYKNVSLGRYKKILDSEFKFYRNYKTDLYSQYRKQLIKRLFKQVLLVNNKKIAYYTLRKILSF